MRSFLGKTPVEVFNYEADLRFPGSGIDFCALTTAVNRRTRQLLEVLRNDS